MTILLKGIKVTKKFGGLLALKDVDFRIEQGGITGFIGPNGAGKTTLFNVISGFYKPDSGKIFFLENDITGLAPHKICKLGISRTFQKVRVFPNMSVFENVLCGGVYGRKDNVDKKKLYEDTKYFIKYIGFNLIEKKDLPVRNLTLAERKFVELAMILNAKPKIILIDEIVSGLNPAETNIVTDIIKNIKEEMGITIFWIEHVMKAVMRIADHIIVLHHGKKISEGPPKVVATDEKVIDAYLGEKYLIT